MQFKYQAKVICDSITEDGVRATTMELFYPYCIHQDMLTYRSIGKSDERQFDEWLEFSRNSASNRALTTETIIQSIRTNLVIPAFRRATKGMVPGDYLSDNLQRDAELEWMSIFEMYAAALLEFKAEYSIHKSHVNRLLAPWQGITTVFTANAEHWLHFFDERADPDSDPLLQPVAYLAQTAFHASTPRLLRKGDWHLPYVDKGEVAGKSLDMQIRMSVAICARTSWLRQNVTTTLREDMKLYDDLVVRAVGDKRKVHASPTEHQLVAAERNVRSGNVYGYYQNRKLLGI